MITISLLNYNTVLIPSILSVTLHECVFSLLVSLFLHAGGISGPINIHDGLKNLKLWATKWITLLSGATLFPSLTDDYVQKKQLIWPLSNYVYYLRCIRQFSKARDTAMNKVFGFIDVAWKDGKRNKNYLQVRIVSGLVRAKSCFLP